MWETKPTSNENESRKPISRLCECQKTVTSSGKVIGSKWSKRTVGWKKIRRSSFELSEVELLSIKELCDDRSKVVQLLFVHVQTRAKEEVMGPTYPTTKTPSARS